MSFDWNWFLLLLHLFLFQIIVYSGLQNTPMLGMYTKSSEFLFIFFIEISFNVHIAYAFIFSISPISRKKSLSVCLFSMDFQAFNTSGLIISNGGDYMKYLQMFACECDKFPRTKQ